MQYDLHVHTAEYSACSSMPAEDVCRLVHALGIDGIALTEHDLWWPQSALAALRSRHPHLVIFNAMERSCREGHFLVFLPEHPQHDRSEPPDTIAALSSWTRLRGGALIWAHPFRYGQTTPPAWLGEVPLDGIEVASSNMNLRMSDLAVTAAEKLGYMQLTNSDAHALDAFGRYFNEFDAEIRTAAELIRFVRNRRGGRMKP